MAYFVSALMSSTYNVIKTFCTDSRNNENLLRSNFSGTSFPSSPVVGQTCYREDLLKEYQWNGTSWVESGSNSIVSNEVIRSRGNLSNLDDRLSVSLNDDGTLRTNVTANISEWIISPLAVTYITSSSFSVVDNQTGVFTRNRLVKCELSASYVCASVLSSSFANGVTTVILDNPVLDSTFQQVSYSVLQKQDEKYSDLLGLRKINYSYSVGDIVYPQAYASSKLLKCIVGGQSGASEITIGDIGTVIVDGGVTWVVCNRQVSDTPLSNHIVSGGKITGVNGLGITFGATEAFISRTLVNKTAGDTQTLDAKKIGLLTLNKSGTRGVQYAVDPTTFVDANTVALWKPDSTSSCPNLAVGVNGNTLAVANALVKSGTVTSVDGLFGGDAAQGDGSTGYYISANSTWFPSGASEREFSVCFSANTNGVVQTLFSYGTTGTNTTFTLFVDTANKLQVSYGSSSASETGFTLEAGKVYIATLQYTSDGTINIFVNGSLIYALSVALATGYSPLNIFRNFAGTQYYSSTIHFIELRNKCHTPQSIAEITAKLCIPVCYDKSSASYPTISTADQATSYHEYKFDKTTGSDVADTAGTMNGVATGTTIVDSPISLGKARKISAGTDYISVGAYTFPSAFTIIAVATIPTTSTPTFVGNYNGTNGNAFQTYGSSLQIWSNTGGSVVSNSIIKLGKPMFLATSVGGGKADLYVDSPIVDKSGSFTPNTTICSTMQIGNNGNGSNPSGVGTIIDYFTIIPRALSQAEIAQYYNSLMGTGRKNITAQLPANTISLGMVRTGATGLLSYNDSDWQYGRREKAALGNRRVFLGRKYFNTGGNTQIPLEWANPFGTRRVSLTYTWSSDASGTNESQPLYSMVDGAALYGLFLYESPSKTTQVAVRAGGPAYFNGAYQTAGYIGCYAEVLEDD